MFTGKEWQTFKRDAVKGKKENVSPKWTLKGSSASRLTVLARVDLKPYAEGD